MRILSSMLTLKKLLDLLTPHERNRAALLLGMILVMALLDAIGVASIMPFMAVLANPQLTESNAFLSAIYNMLGFNNVQNFLFFLGVVLFALLVISLTFKALTTYAQLRFTYMREYSLSRRLIEGYLHQPYTWFINRHSADLSKTVLSEVNTVVYGSMWTMITLIAQASVAIALLMLIFYVDPLLAFIAGSVMGLVYLFIYKIVSAYLSRIGKERVKLNQMRFTAVSEAFGSVKEVKVGRLEKVFIRRFAKPAVSYVRHQVSAKVVALLPRFAMEAIAFGGLLLVVLYLMARDDGFANALPIMSLYAFAGYRLMPALQQIYGSASQLRFTGPALDALHADLMSLTTAHPSDTYKSKIKFEKKIALKNVEYTYPNADKSALNDISLSILANSTVGLVGSTGSGKTTTVDLILGLLEPQQGSITVDDISINSSNRCQWQAFIGYVPQQINLIDDSVAANIAFGVEADQIDQNAIERAAKIANLHDFVVNDLTQGYATTVGERGIRLSGGQRQRIGIARALYHNPQVLVLDEATSALDNLTEQAVMDAVNNLGHKITIIMIAHRLSTVRQCDQIFLLEQGKIIAQGTYDKLANENEIFRAMATK